MKKLLVLLLCILLIFSFAACGGKKNDDKGDVQVALTDGTYTREASEFASSGYKDTLTLTVEGGKITSVVWDAVDENGNTKRDAVAAGQYVMPGELSWTQQADALANEVIENQGTANLNPTDGKIDTVSGVTMGVSWFVESVNDILKEASK